MTGIDKSKPFEKKRLKVLNIHRSHNANRTNVSKRSHLWRDYLHIWRYDVSDCPLIATCYGEVQTFASLKAPSVDGPPAEIANSPNLKTVVWLSALKRARRISNVYNVQTFALLKAISVGWDQATAKTPICPAPVAALFTVLSHCPSI